MKVSKFSRTVKASDIEVMKELCHGLDNRLMICMVILPKSVGNLTIFSCGTEQVEEGL